MRRISEVTAVSLTEIAEKTGAVVFGSDALEVTTICPLDEPLAGALTFVSGTPRRAVLEQLQRAGIRAAFVRRDIFSADDTAVRPEGLTLLAVADPFLAIIDCVPFFYRALEPEAGISPQAVVDPSAVLGENVAIAPFCYVGADVRLGDNVRLFPQVTVYEGAQIGENTVIHSGAVIREECRVGADSVIQNGAIIGADGFGYRPDAQQGLVPFPQVGIVDLAPRVDVGANACVDRGALGDTRIGLGTKIDNLVQVGHNTRIGRHSILCGQVGVSGSCSIGDQVTLAGGVGVADHVTIASKTRFGARCGITSSIKEEGDYAGWPAMKASEWKRQAALLRSLPSVVRELRRALKTVTNEE